jgi:hypothetical protein
MGDVDVKQVKNIDPVTIKSIDQVTNIDPLRIAKIAPAAVHVKELNHIDPISIDSLRVDEMRNIDPFRIERFDVTTLPTVNLSIGDAPSLDLNIRRIPPLAIGLGQNLVLPSEYQVRARLLGLEILRVHITGRTMLRPCDEPRRETSKSHERSQREVAAVGNPAIPVVCTEESAEAVVHRPAPVHPRHRRRQHAPVAQRGELRVGAPPAHASIGLSESAVASG